MFFSPDKSASAAASAKFQRGKQEHWLEYTKALHTAMHSACLAQIKLLLRCLHACGSEVRMPGAGLVYAGAVQWYGTTDRPIDLSVQGMHSGICWLDKQALVPSPSFLLLFFFPPMCSTVFLFPLGLWLPRMRTDHAGDGVSVRASESRQAVLEFDPPVAATWAACWSRWQPPS